jgi:hypothetical protein
MEESKMKKISILTIASAFLMLMASCQKSPVQNAKGDGFLSFGEFSLEVDEAVDTKADPAGDNYSIEITDADGTTVKTLTYAQVKANGDMVTLPSGVYTLVAKSLAGEVPVASWENPVYGTSKQFIIKAGEVTQIGNLTCTLVQCKVTISYSDEFLAAITGPGATSVEVTAGYPLEYTLGEDGVYDQSAGYFAVGEGNTMTVVFKGKFEGKNANMTKTFTGIEARQWRQVKFIKKKNEQGDATYDILINDLVSDEVLNNAVDAEEEIIGDDPDAPKGDGGITLDFDYEAGCDEELTDLNNMVIVPVEVRDMSIKLKATVPGGILKFSVEVQSDNGNFNNALDAAGGAVIDLINPSAANDVIFQVVPFPHGEDLLGQTEVAFDLSAAQDAIINYKGTHTFLMTVVDQAFCTKKLPVTMIVE